MMAVAQLDRRHAHCWVPIAEVPETAPERLAKVARAVTVDRRVVGWWLDTAAVLAHSDTGAVAAFAEWSAQHTRRYLVGEAHTAAAAIAAVPQLAELFDGYLLDGFSALGDDQVSAAIAAELDVETAAAEVRGDAAALVDAGTGRRIPARTWPTEPGGVLSTDGNVTLGVDDTGLWCDVGDRRIDVAGWRIEGDGVTVETSSGDAHIVGQSATVLTRQAAGSARVGVESVPMAEVCSDVIETLWDCLDTAGRAGRYMLLSNEPAA